MPRALRAPGAPPPAHAWTCDGERALISVRASKAAQVNLRTPQKESLTMKNPLARVKDVFGDKAKLVAAVEKFTGDDLWVGRMNANKGLAHVSNAKLLRLHDVFSAVKEKFGTRAKLIDAVLELEKRTKDAGFRSRLEAYPVPRLWDMYRSAQKRSGGGADKAATKKAPAKKVAPKAPAKKAPAKKTAAKKSTKK
jgi:hypothetical protein